MLGVLCCLCYLQARWMEADMARVCAVKMDVGGGGTRCSGLVAHVLDLHLRDMMHDGTLLRLWSKYKTSKHDTGFACPPPEAARKQRTALSMEVCHLCATGACPLSAIVRPPPCRERRRYWPARRQAGACKLPG